MFIKKEKIYMLANMQVTGLWNVTFILVQLQIEYN